VLGKFFVIFSTGIVAAILSLTGLGFILATKGKQVTGPFAEILKVMHKKNKTKKPGNVISALYHLIVLLVFLNSVSF